ncbi:hypothetical protein ACVWZV_000275 [Bradyrhizobium sp. GM5.1]
MDCFIEGPSFDKSGDLYVVDIPFGRIFRISRDGIWSLIIEYDGWPIGLKIAPDGRVQVADYMNGLMELDPQRDTSARYWGTAITSPSEAATTCISRPTATSISPIRGELECTIRPAGCPTVSCRPARLPDFELAKPERAGAQRRRGRVVRCNDARQQQLARAADA